MEPGILRISGVCFPTTSPKSLLDITEESPAFHRRIRPWQSWCPVDCQPLLKVCHHEGQTGVLLVRDVTAVEKYTADPCHTRHPLCCANKLLLKYCASEVAVVQVPRRPQVVVYGRYHVDTT